MRSRSLALRLGGAVSALGLIAIGGMAALSRPALAADSQHPVVVELFQSQGCSSCPPANANVMAIADRPDVLALSWQVTYWDQLGWKDTFGSPAFTASPTDFNHRIIPGPVPSDIKRAVRKAPAERNVMY